MANCNSFIVRSVSSMLEATWSTSLVMNSGSWRLTAISLSERILFSRRSISRPDELVVLAGLVQVGQPAAAGVEVVLQRRAHPLRGACSCVVGRQLGDLLLELRDALLDLVGGWSSARTGTGRTACRAAADGSTTAGPGRSVGIRPAARRRAHAGTFQLQGDVAQLDALGAQRSKRCSNSRGSLLEDVVAGSAGWPASFRSRWRFASWAST